MGDVWEKAPEGATHRGLLSEMFYKLVDGEPDLYWSWYFNRWTDSEFASADAVPLAPEWSGEGNPPVGTVCEWKEKSGFLWVGATVLFISDQSVVLKRFDGFEWQLDVRRTTFRPTRTAEQLAAEEERDKGIKALFTVGNKLGIPASYSDWAAVYDQGCRLPKEI